MMSFGALILVERQYNAGISVRLYGWNVVWMTLFLTQAFCCNTMKKETSSNIPETYSLKAQLDSLVRGDIDRWYGLPSVSIDEVKSILGKAEEVQEAAVGAHPAGLYRFSHSPSGSKIDIYERHGMAIMVEVRPVPNVDLLSVLGAPTAVLPQELSIEGAYAHEYLYCDRGLLMTVAQDLSGKIPDKVIRLRGIKKMKGPDELNSELYFPLDAQENW